MDLKEKINDILIDVLQGFYIDDTFDIDIKKEEKNIYYIEFKREKMEAHFRVRLEEKPVVSLIFFHTEENSFDKNLRFVNCFQSSFMEELFLNIF